MNTEFKSRHNYEIFSLIIVHWYQAQAQHLPSWVTTTRQNPKSCVLVKSEVRL